jgi:hypothetical protein
VSKQDAQLIQRMAVVARNSGRAWSDFLAEYKLYADRVKDRCVEAPPHQLQVVQGHARECAAMVKMFEGCCEAADKLAEQKAK